MLRSRRESHHSNGITEHDSLQPTSATKSALLGPPAMSAFAPLSGAKRTSAASASAWRRVSPASCNDHRAADYEGRPSVGLVLPLPSGAADQGSWSPKNVG